MATSDGFDLYTCQVCFDNMVYKDPRLLSCHHSFCMNCLKKIIKKNAIWCPTCREITVLPNNDIYSLKVNFMLNKFMAQMDKVQSSDKALCQFCLDENAALKCQECSQLICEECSEKHKAMKTFKDHKIYKLCDKHKDGMITHVCIKCARPACAKCVMTEHFDHEAEIQLIDEGIDLIGDQMLKCEEDVDEVIKSVNEWQEEDTKDLVNILTAIEKVEEIKSYHKEKVTQAEKVLETLKIKQEEGKERQRKYETKINKCRNVKSLFRYRAKDLKNGELESYFVLKNETEKLVNDLKQGHTKLLEERLTILDPRNGQEINLSSIKTEKKSADTYLESPVLEKKMNCPGCQQWQQPWNVSIVDTECVLLSDWNKSQVTCVYLSDKPPVNILSHHGYVRDASVYQNHLYTAYRDCVSKRTFYNGVVGTEVKYKPNIHDTYSMVVVNESCLVLVSHSEERVVEFNPTTNHTKVVANLDGPVQVNLVKRDGRLLFFVTCRGNSHNIQVFDEMWVMLFSFGGMGHEDGKLLDPWSTTFTSQGILVSDLSNHRICLFSYDGHFVKHVLTSKDDIGRPMGLGFVRPHIWLTSHNPVSVKCFKLCQ